MGLDADGIVAWLDKLEHKQRRLLKRKHDGFSQALRDDNSCSLPVEPIKIRRPLKRLRPSTPPKSSHSAMNFSLPSHSLFSDGASSSASSINITDLSHNNDQTPTKKRRAVLPPFGAPSPSRRSGSISPRKQVRNAAAGTARIISYDATKVPPALRALWRSIGDYDGGIGVIGHDERAAVEDAVYSIPEFQEQSIRDFVFEPTPANAGDGGPTAPRARLGPTPSVATVLDIVRTGKRCRDHGLDEQSWNAHVHTRVLSLAFRGIWQDPDGSLLTCILCSTASILPSYVESSGRKVDLCVCIEPDDLSATAISALRRQDQLSRLSINHTDYEPLQTRPIALSVETKKHGEDLSDAEAQLVIWHSAQWRLLRRLVERAEPNMSLPDFIPGIIIQGHEWMFVASTMNDNAVTLWTSQVIGSTTRVLGVYQIVCVLQYLKRWIEETYWPWYQLAVLRLPNQTHGSDGS